MDPIWHSFGQQDPREWDCQKTHCQHTGTSAIQPCGHLCGYTKTLHKNTPGATWMVPRGEQRGIPLCRGDMGSGRGGKGGQYTGSPGRQGR